MNFPHEKTPPTVIIYDWQKKVNKGTTTKQDTLSLFEVEPDRRIFAVRRGIF